MKDETNQDLERWRKHLRDYRSTVILRHNAERWEMDQRHREELMELEIMSERVEEAIKAAGVTEVAQ